MPFFLANAAAITFEDGVIAVARRLGVGSDREPAVESKGKEGPPPRWVRIIGYAWVFAWFSYALRLFVWWTIPYGMGKTRSNVVPFSVVLRFAPDSLWVPLHNLFGSAVGRKFINVHSRLNLMKASL